MRILERVEYKLLLLHISNDMKIFYRLCKTGGITLGLRLAFCKYSANLQNRRVAF
jgi:hypothetical protein